MTELQTTSWPTFTGLGGLSAVAGAADADHTGGRAAAAVRAWSPTRPVAVFPFREVLEHFGVVGRMHVDESVLLPLRAANAAEASGDRWPLPLWLPNTVDRSVDAYDGYLLTDLLLSVVDLAEEDSVTQLLAGLAADLLAGESAMLCAAPGRQQRARTAAVATMLSRLSTSDAERTVRRLRAASDVVFADFAADLAAATRTPLRPDLVLAVRIGHLPVTPLHDEHMFLRCAQILEVLYAYLGRRLQVAGQALGRGDALAAVAEAERAIGRAQLAQPLHRVLATMPPSSLETIHAHWDGSSVRSRHYRRIELIRAVARTLEPGMTAALADRMTALDEAWHTMKHAARGMTDPATTGRHPVLGAP